MSGLRLQIPNDASGGEMVTPTAATVRAGSRRSTVSSGEVTIKSGTPTPTSRHRSSSRGGSTSVNYPPGSGGLPTQPLPAVPPLPTSVKRMESTATTQTAQTNTSSPTTTSNSTKKDEPPAKPVIPRSGLHESQLLPFYQKYPKMSQFSDTEVSNSSMYWSKAPVWGSMPTHCFKSHSCTVVGNVVWIIGGRYGPDGKNDSTGWDEPIPPKDTPFRNVWCFDTISLSWSHPLTKGDCPPPLRAHSACLFPPHTIIIFGGGGWDGHAQRSIFYNDIYALDTRTYIWTNLSPFLEKGSPKPEARRSHSAVVKNRKMYVFGGGSGRRSLSDLWVLDLGEAFLPASKRRLRWREIKSDLSEPDSSPSARGYHSANMIQSHMIIYGGVKGLSGDVVHDDIWTFNVDTNEWTNVTPGDDGPRRAFHTSTHIGPYLFIFGGHDGVNYQHKVLMFNLVELMWDNSHTFPGRKPSPRGYHGAAYSDLRMWVFGGMNGDYAPLSASATSSSLAHSSSAGGRDKDKEKERDKETKLLSPTNISSTNPSSPTATVASTLSSTINPASAPGSSNSGGRAVSSSRSRAGSVREDGSGQRFTPQHQSQHQQYLSSSGTAPVARSASISESIMTVASSVSGMSTLSERESISSSITRTERDAFQPSSPLPPSPFPTTAPTSTNPTPISSTIPLSPRPSEAGFPTTAPLRRASTSATASRHSQKGGGDRAQVLNDVYMLDLGAYAYIPLVTNYTIDTSGYKDTLEGDEEGTVSEYVEAENGFESGGGGESPTVYADEPRRPIQWRQGNVSMPTSPRTIPPVPRVQSPLVPSNRR